MRIGGFETGGNGAEEGREETLETRNADVCVKLEGEWETWRGDVGYFFRRVFSPFLFFPFANNFKATINPILFPNRAELFIIIIFFFETITVCVPLIMITEKRKNCTRAEVATREAHRTRVPRRKSCETRRARLEFFYDINGRAVSKSNYLSTGQNFILTSSTGEREIDHRRIDSRYAVDSHSPISLCDPRNPLTAATSLLEKMY